MTFSIFMMLCNYHLCLIPSLQSKTPNSLSIYSSLHPPYAPGNHHSTLCIYGSTYYEYLIKIEYMSFNVCLLLVSIMFSRYIHISVLHSFYGWIIFHCMYSGPLNNVGLKCMGPLICDFISPNTYYSTTRSAVSWICECRTADFQQRAGLPHLMPALFKGQPDIPQIH